MKILKRARKRGLALFMALVMCLSLLPVTAMAAEEPAQTETAAAVTGSEQDASAEEPGEDAPLEEAAEAEDAPIEEAANAGDASNGEESNAEDTSIEEETTPEDVSNAEDPSNEEDAGAEDPSDEEEPNAEAPSDKEEADAEDASEEAEPEEDAAGSADELAGLVRQFRELLDAMEAFALTAENQEEYQALGMQAAALLELLTENWDSWDSMENDLARFQALADKQTGGASEAALISGEKFTVDVVKVVNGNAVDSVTLTQKCLQTTGHSGYNHSTNLRTLANLSGFSGYKGYNWSKYTTVPSTYTEGLAPNNNYASVHYNITGSAPYKANETLFLFFEENTTFTLRYDANGGSGAPGPQTKKSSTSSVDFIVSPQKPTRPDYTFKGWANSKSATTADYDAGDRITLHKVDSPKTLYAVWEKENTGPVQATYTVEWYDVDGESLKVPETRNGTVGSKVEVTNFDKIIDGYTFDENNQGNILSDTLEENGTVLRLYFTKDVEQPMEADYTVEWYDAGTGSLLPIEVKAVNPETRTGEISSEVEVTADDKIVTGYTFDESNNDNVLSGTLAESGTVLKLYFTKDAPPPKEASCTVVHEYYTNNVKDGDTKSVISGNVGDIITGEDIEKAPTYNGQEYSYTSTAPDLPYTLTDGSNTITLRYDRTADVPKEASYTVEWYDAGTGNLLPSAVKAINPETRTGEIGSTVAVTDGDKSIAGYAFKADDGRNVLSADLVQSGAVLKLYFTKDEEQPAEIRYSVEWYDASTNRLLPSAVKAANPEVRTAAAGSTVSVTTEDMSIAGYVFDAGNAGNILSALAQSGAVLRLYFVRNSQEPGNPDPIFPPPAPDAVTPITPAPTPLGPGPDTVTLLDDDVPLAAPGLNSVDHYAYIIGYTDGLVHPEANITRAEVATIFFRLMTDEFRMEHWATENSFPDVQAKNWFNNGVSTSAKAGIIKGYEDGSFRPNRNITRAEFAAIAARFLSDEVNLPVSFSDISGHWAENEINRAVKAGWIKGYTDGTFRPDQPITRAEAVTLINRMLDRTPDKDHLLPDMIRWPDNTEDKWYYAAMQEATNSHDYERLEMDVTEDWTELLENRDWVQLEKEWSTAASAPGEEVADNLDLSKTGENA